ncbi:MAG: endonuclease III [Bacteroidota bacterium]|nr:endonuclease III [Bacteroidota bacterium]MDP4230146.1 endonuclease III [Bacteroidota bacterium]MDP4235499.1 endonuclease III [Bacteroidota bacterium]
MAKETKEQKHERTKKIFSKLRKMYPQAHCALDFTNAFELLVATILSAQCTDARVNIVMKSFRPRFPTPKSLAHADLSEIEEVIKSTGFFRQKAKSLKSMATDIIEKFRGKVPQTMAELTTLRGVGRKTANVVLGNAFGIAEGIAVDTHVTRVANLLKITTHKEPEKIERDLMELVPKKEWTMATHYLISHGRKICIARSPKCPECGIADLCPSKKIYFPE